MSRVVFIGSDSAMMVKFRGRLIETIVEHGHEVIGCNPDHDEAWTAPLRQKGVSFQTFAIDPRGSNPLEELRGLLTLTAMMRDLRPDVVVAYTPKHFSYGAIAAKLAGVAGIHGIISGLGYVHTTEQDDLKFRVLKLLTEQLYRAACLCADHVFFQNPDDLAFFVDHRFLLQPHKAIRVNGSGVDLDTYAFAPPIEAPIRFLLVARLLLHKGLGEFVEAARLLKPRYPEAEFLLLGPLHDNPAGVQRHHVEAWEAEGLVRWLGSTSDVRPTLRDASVMVLPSYREGTPNSVLEALAMGRPIITTDAPGCRETVEHGVNGFLVPIKQVPPLAEAMERFLLDPSLIAPMGAASRALAARKFDVRRVIETQMRAMGLWRALTPQPPLP